jgi:hypothetical protein
MKQREVILAAWERRSQNHAPTPHFQRAQEFFQMMMDNPDICWDELVAEFRNNYYDAFDEIVPVLMDTGDPLIIYNCIRFANLDNPKEEKAAKRFVQDSDVDVHQVAMKRLAATPAMHSALKKRSSLPKAVLATMANAIAQPASASAPAPKKAATKARKSSAKKQSTS